jgi:hypothetical protein
MEATCSSKTFFDFHCTARCYIPEDTILHDHCPENLKPYPAGQFVRSSWRQVSHNLPLRIVWQSFARELLRCQALISKNQSTYVTYLAKTLTQGKVMYNETVHQLFADFKKAYDSVRREVLYNDRVWGTHETT